MSVRGAGGRELAREEVPTGSSHETLGAVREVLSSQGTLEAVGVACFGPLDTRTGRLLSTPKEGWAGVDLAAALSLGPHTRLRFETDPGEGGDPEDPFTGRDAMEGILGDVHGVVEVTVRAPEQAGAIARGARSRWRRMHSLGVMIS